jgi:hypothetical protein
LYSRHGDLEKLSLYQFLEEMDLTEDFLHNIIVQILVTSDVRSRQYLLLDELSDFGSIHYLPPALNSFSQGSDVLLSTRSLEMKFVDVQKILWVGSGEMNIAF